MTKQQSPPKDEMWIDKHGNQIPVGQMSEDHAKNALRMILRNKRKRALMITKLAMELVPAINHIQSIKDEARVAELEKALNETLTDDALWGDS